MSYCFLCVFESKAGIGADRKELPVMENTHAHTHVSHIPLVCVDSWWVGGKTEEQLSLRRKKGREVGAVGWEGGDYIHLEMEKDEKNRKDICI